MRYVTSAFLLIFLTSLTSGMSLDVTMIRQGQDFKFPILSSTNNSSSASRINRFLQLSELYAIAKPPYSASIFDQVQTNDGSIYGGKHALVSTVYTNNASIFSLGIANSSCGATCTWWSSYYTFNLASGDRIELQDLFSKDDYDRFFKYISRKRSDKYKREVVKKVDPEYQEAFLDTLGCFENDRKPDFFVKGSSLVIDGDSCLIKSQVFEGLDMRVTFKFPTIKQYLNSYGRAAFENRPRKMKTFRSRQLPQLFEGKVDDKFPIAMILKREYEGSFWGMYAYLRYGKGLSLRGEEKNGEISLTEYMLSPEIIDNELGEHQRVESNGYISGRLTKDRFDAQWTDVGKTRSLTFTAAIR